MTMIDFPDEVADLSKTMGGRTAMARRVGVRLIPVDGQSGQVRALGSLSEHEQWFGAFSSTGLGPDATPAALLDEIDLSGLRGRGGGWFPTGRKMRAVVDSAGRRSPLSSGRRPVVIANAMEGEPASTKDAVLISHAPHLLLEGIGVAARAIGAKRAYLAVHRGSPLIPGLDAAIAQHDGPVTIELVTPPARYVASEESALAHWAGDGLATPVYGARPFERGMNGRPTLVQNAETLANLALISRHGGEWFATIGDPDAPGTTLVTVGGAVGNPGVIEVPTGTRVADLLQACGGLTGPVEGFLTGGYGGAWVSAEALIATQWAPQPVAGAGGVVGAGILWALSPDLCPLDEMARVAQWMAGESAGQCGPCRFGLPSVAEDVALLAGRHVTGEDLARLSDRLSLVVNRGGCKHPDGTARFVTSGLRTFADEVALHTSGRCGASRVHRDGAAGSLPLPAGRATPVKVAGKEFR